MPVVDLDAELEKRAEQSISNIFKEKGEDWFRAQEAVLLAEQSKQTHCVVATGGGIVLRRQNRELLCSTGTVVFLDTSFDVLWSRVSKEKGRPLLEDFDPRQKLMSIWQLRQPFYEECSELCVMTDGKTAMQVAEEIQGQLRENN